MAVYVHLSESSPWSIMTTRPSIVVNEWDDNPSLPHLIYDTLKVRSIGEYSGLDPPRVLIFGLI